MTIQISSRVLKRQADGVIKHDELVGPVVGLKYMLNKNGACRKKWF